MNRSKILMMWLAGLLLLTACAGPATNPPRRSPLKIEWTQWWGDYTLIVAQAKGFFEKHGVTVEPVYYAVFSQALPDLAAAKIDGGLFTIGDALAVALNDDVKVVMVYDTGGTSQMVVTPDIQTAADLKGKRIGVNIGAYTELYVREVLKSSGLTLDDVSLVNVDPEAVPDRMPNDIQAGYTWEPYASQALAAGNHLLSVEDRANGLFPDVITFRNAVVKERPEDVRAFLAAWSEAVAYRQANPAECEAIIATATGLGPDDIASADDRLYTAADNQRLFAPENALEADSILRIAQINLDFLIQTGSVSSPPVLKQLLDPSFLP